MEKNIRIKVINPEKPSIPFREWMWRVVKSEYYSDDEAMSRAQESIQKQVLC